MLPRFSTRPDVVLRAVLLIEHLRGQQPVVHESVAARIVPVDRLREGGDVADVMEDVVTEDAVRAAEGVQPVREWREGEGYGWVSK